MICFLNRPPETLQMILIRRRVEGNSSRRNYFADESDKSSRGTGNLIPAVVRVEDFIFNASRIFVAGRSDY